MRCIPHCWLILSGFSGLAELEQQAKLKESMRLTLKEPTSEDEGQEDGEESTGTNDTQFLSPNISKLRSQKRIMSKG